MAELSKKALEHLAGLARLELNPQEEEKLLKDLQAILDHFKELQEADTKNIEPLTGGTSLKNVFRQDKAGISNDVARGSEAFPESHDGYLKVPPVF